MPKPSKAAMMDRLGVIHPQAMLYVDLVVFFTVHKTPLADNMSRRRRIN
jgi:hypothetical protein